jgi:hypothetical protein
MFPAQHQELTYKTTILGFEILGILASWVKWNMRGQVRRRRSNKRSGAVKKMLKTTGARK